MTINDNPYESLHVLVVDDHMMMRSLVTQNLRTLGVKEIDTALNGEDAWKKIQDRQNMSSPYQIVFLDWNMPVMTGVEVLKACRSNKKFDNVAIVMLTAEQEQKNVLEAVRLGATSYMVKPVSQDTFEKNMTKIFEWLKKKDSNISVSRLEKSSPRTNLPPEIDKQLKPIIAKGIESIFSTLFSVKILPVDYTPDQLSKAMICVGRLHQNDTQIQLRFFFDQALLKPLMMQLYAPEFLEDNKVYEDAACEIINILCAQVKFFMNNKGYNMVTDFPEMASKASFSKDDPALNVHFSLNDEKYFLVDVSSA